MAGRGGSALDETGILAGYSFVEYELGERSDASIERLLEIEQKTYDNIILYAYFTGPERADFMHPVAGRKGEMASTAVGDIMEEHWATLSSASSAGTSGNPSILPFYANGDVQMLSFAYPVFAGGSFRGALYIGIDLERYADRYLKPYLTDKSSFYAITGPDGRILWCPNLEHLNQNIAQAMPFLERQPEDMNGKEVIETGGKQYFTTWSGVRLVDTHFHVIKSITASSIFSLPQQVRGWRLVINLLLLFIVILTGLYTLRLYRAYMRQLQQIRRENLLQREVKEKREELATVAHR